MEEVMPDVFAELSKVRARLEKHYRDMQDIEFTVQQGKLWMLQTRTGKRTARRRSRSPVEMVGDGVIGKEEAVRRIEPASLDQLLHPMLDPRAKKAVLARGCGLAGRRLGHHRLSADEAELRPARARASSWCASRPAPRTFTACMRRAAFSPPRRHGRATPRWWRAAWAGPASPAPATSASTTRRAPSRRATSSPRRRHHHPQRLDRRDHPRRRADDQPELSGDFATLMGWAARDPHE